MHHPRGVLLLPAGHLRTGHHDGRRPGHRRLDHARPERRTPGAGLHRGSARGRELCAAHHTVLCEEEAEEEG